MRLGRRADVRRCRSQLALARVRRGRRVGLLTDAFALPALCAADADCAARDADASTRRKARSVFEPTPAKIEMLRRPADAPVSG